MIEQSVLEYFANALWQLPLLALGSWLLVSALRPGPSVQHRIWLAALVLALALPAVRTSHPILTTSRATASSYALLAQEPSAAYQRDDPSAQPQYEIAPTATSLRTPVQTPPQASAPTPDHRLRVTLSPRGAHVILGLLAASLLLGAFRIAHAWRAARRLVRDSEELALSPTQRTAWVECAERFQVRLPRIRSSHAIASPVIVGAFDPVLLLPNGFARHTGDEVRAVLCHELAHIARRDYLANLFCLVAALPLVWHPVSHHMQRRIGRTREMACDQMAAEAMDSEAVYARCLLALARQMFAGDRAMDEVGVVGLLGHNVLEERLMRLMATKTTMTVRAKLVRGMSGALVMGAVIVTAMFLRVTPMLASVASSSVPTQTISAVPPAEAAPAPDPLLPVSPEAPLAAPLTPQAALPAPAPSSEPAVPPALAKPAFAAAPAPAPAAQPETLPDQVTGNSSSSGPASSAARAGQSHSASASMSSSDGAGHSFSMDQDGDGRVFVTRDGVRRELTPAEAEEMRRDIDARVRVQVDAATAHVRSPEFRNQMIETSRKLADEQVKLYKLDAEKYRLEAEKQAQYFQSPEFKKEMDKLNSPEFKRQMEDAQRALQAAGASLHGPEFKLQIEQAQLDALKPQPQPNTAQLQRKLDAATRQMEAASHQMEAASHRLEEATRALQEAQAKAPKDN